MEFQKERREKTNTLKKKIMAKRKTGQRGLLITTYKRLEKRLWWGHNSCRGDSPCPSHLESPESPQAKQLRHLHAQPSLGRAATGKKMSHVYACRVTSVVSDSLRPCRLWPARLLCQGGVLQARILERIGQYWLPHAPRALYFLLP